MIKTKFKVGYNNLKLIRILSLFKNYIFMNYHSKIVDAKPLILALHFGGF